jgi:hypothetical protein
VDEAGVWVHNSGNALCQKAFSIYHRHRQHLNASPETAFAATEAALKRLMGKQGLYDSIQIKHLGDVLDQAVKEARSLPDGDVLWTAGPYSTWQENMWSHWVKRQNQGSYPNMVSPLEYVNKAIDLTSNPGPTAMVGERVKGGITERLFLDTATGDFAVKVMSGPETGALKTLFPINGSAQDWLTYWNKQNITLVIQ